MWRVDITYNLNLNCCGLIFFPVQIQNPSSLESSTELQPQFWSIMTKSLVSSTRFLISNLYHEANIDSYPYLYDIIRVVGQRPS
jgi:hypothetical protein